MDAEQQVAALCGFLEARWAEEEAAGGDVSGKRGVVALLRDYQARPRFYATNARTAGAVEALTEVLRLLAAAYEGHPDYPSGQRRG